MSKRIGMYRNGVSYYLHTHEDGREMGCEGCAFLHTHKTSHNCSMLRKHKECLDTGGIWLRALRYSRRKLNR